MDKLNTLPWSWDHPVFLIQYMASMPNPDWYPGLPEEDAWVLGAFTVTISLN